MTCDKVRTRLTAYLDGDLDADAGTVVRGHLRGCAACREVATAEATVRDGLRQLPTLDPPPAMWAAVQARLAEAEVAEARRPAWRRALARWAPAAPRFAIGGLAVAVAIAILWWRTQRTETETTEVVAPAPVENRVNSVTSTQVEYASSAQPGTHVPTGDVTADLMHEPTQIASTYADAADELLAIATEVRAGWTIEQQSAFDAKLAELRASIVSAGPGRPQQRAYQTLIRYLQGAVVRDDVLLASGGTP